MKRKYKGILTICAAIAMVIAPPMLGSADIFLKPHSDKSEKAEDGSTTKKRSLGSYLFVPFSKKKAEQPVERAAKKTTPYYKKKTVQIADNRDVVPVGKADPRLLTMRGPGPQTADELRAVAASHRSVTLAAMRELNEMNQIKTAMYMERVNNNYEAKRVRTERVRSRSNVAEKENVPTTNAVRRKKVNKYTTLGTKKPRKVFTDY